MKHPLVCLSACLLLLGTDAGRVLAQNVPQSKAEVEAGIAEQKQRAEEAAAQKAVENTAVFETSVSNFRYQQKNEPVPLFVNPGDAQGILLPSNAVYAQSQAGTFGQPPAEWLAIGKSLFPPGDPTSPYGVRLNWDSALAVFNLVDKGIAGQKDLVIGFGGNADDLLKFNFFPTVTSSASTTVVSVSSAGNVRAIGATRDGAETGTTQPPFVGTTGYVGLVTRRINDTNLSAGSVLARTEVLTLERDGTFGGIRISNPSGAAFQSLVCTGVTAAGAVVGRSLIVPGGVSSVFSDGQQVVSVQCSFGDAFFLNNITQVFIQRYPNDFYWAGTTSSTFNQ